LNIKSTLIYIITEVELKTNLDQSLFVLEMDSSASVQLVASIVSLVMSKPAFCINLSRKSKNLSPTLFSESSNGLNMSEEINNVFLLLAPLSVSIFPMKRVFQNVWINFSETQLLHTMSN
jgi:hypothetical protein